MCPLQSSPPRSTVDGGILLKIFGDRICFQCPYPNENTTICR
ncbi:hypothetical protein KC19_N042600 [Ceratodon purpureus]|nr:hypothetical protein KC19_N042600 [Ceratodon purpureus]